MEKMKTLFVRDFTSGECPATREIAAGCEWVSQGEGTPTQKLDGTACMVRDGKFYKRYTAKGKKPPDGFEPVGEPENGKQPGWVPVGEGPEDAHHREAFEPHRGDWTDGTYELIGPKIQGNPEHWPRHYLARHDLQVFASGNVPPRDYDGLREYLARMDIEGIVWHHPDGRMVKLKKSDFGLPRIPDA